MLKVVCPSTIPQGVEESTSALYTFLALALHRGEL